MGLLAPLLRPFFFVLALVCAAQATGALEATQDGCGDACPQDEQNGQCPPTCVTCGCVAWRVAGPVPLLALGPPPALLPSAVRAAWPSPAAPLAPVLGAVMHVPIPLAA